MTIQNISIVLFSLGALLFSSCKDHSPTSQSGITNFSTVRGTEPLIYEAIDLQFWEDAEYFPVVAVVSIQRGESIHGIPYESKTEQGVIQSISITTSKGKTDLPLFEDSLISKREVPLYFTTDGRTITKIHISIDDFNRLKELSEDKKFDNAKALLENHKPIKKL